MRFFEDFKRTMMRRLSSASLAAALGAVVMSASAAFAVERATNQAAAAAAANQRADLLQGLGDEMDMTLGPMVRNPARFDAAAAKASADKMAGLAARIPAAFSVDTRGFRVRTSAKDNIWETFPDFQAKARALSGAIAGLQQAAAGGQRDAVVQAIVKVGQTCRACHTGYKAD